VRLLRPLAAVACAAAMLFAAGCDRIGGAAATPFAGIDVTGSEMGRDLRLTDHTGKERTLADFRGKVVLVIFGFTQCPDVCPTTLANAASAVRQMGEDAKHVQVVFITVDPKRDTLELLRQYVTAFDPQFLGMGGDPARVLKTAKDFNMYVVERPGKTPDAYTVDHSTQMYAFDRQGRVRLVIPHSSTPAAIASDLKILLN
jgi:protein SCO1/2